MAVTEEAMVKWCRALLGDDGAKLSLEEYLDAIPRLSSLSDVGQGTPVLVRGDTDAKPGANVGEGDVRLRSMVDTLKFGIDQGWKQIIFGHIGRDPEGTLAKVAGRLGELLQRPVPLVSDWLNDESTAINGHVTERISAAAPGSVMMLDNTRRYEAERLLWKATTDDLPALAPRLAKLAGEFADKVARVYVHEAFSAGSLDSSSTVIPAAMDRVALGSYAASEFDGPLRRCLATRLVVFSGLKTDKLDDLEAMIARGTIRQVFTAGSLAMALKKGAAALDGGQFSMGVAEDPAHRDKPYYIPPRRVEQAQAMLAAGREKGIEFVLPVDFILQDGQASDTIGPGDQQFDVGPKTNELFAEKVGQFIAEHTGDAAESGGVVFHNGVFGIFEDSRFEEGTRRFVSQLKRMTDAGLEVYVGGGEGGKALEQYGQPDWVTHCFTAGGTVLNALGSEPVPYLVALRMAAGRQ